ncbi:MAG: hypothetical protein IPK81_13920 [Rhodospirillales bacterium]|nr:MAG: hypothetical protein IPK81_13920 [Rhodospirillales bacterium]
MFTIAIQALFWVAFAVVCALPAIRAALARRLVFRALLVAVCVAASLIGPTTLGLEYEDAYVHQAAAYLQTAHFASGKFPFYLDVCVAGTVADCTVQATFGTHLPGYASLLSILQHMVGERRWLANATSIAATALAVQVCWSLLEEHATDPAARALAMCLLLAAPGFHLVGGSTFAEPLFAFLVVCHVKAQLDVAKEGQGRHGRLGASVLFVASGALMILTKKEGVLVPGVACVAAAAMFVARQRSGDRSTGAVVTGAMAAGLVMFAVFGVGILDAAGRHGADIGRAAFALENVPRLLPALASAALSTGDFGILGIAAVAALPVVVLGRDRVGLRLVAILAGFALLYTSHARHRHFAAGGDVDPAEMVRYVHAMAPLAAVVVGIAASRAAGFLRAAGFDRAVRASVALAAMGLVGWLPVAAVELDTLRSGIARAEAERRLAAVTVVPVDRREGAIFVTPFPAALVSAYGARTRVVDSASLGYADVRELVLDHARRGGAVGVDPSLCVGGAPAELDDLCALGWRER